MKELWALWSSWVDPYCNWELLQVFTDEATAWQVRAELVDKQARQFGGAYLWHQDPDGDELFDDLHVRRLYVA